jgi:hypothetical protein
MDHYEELGISPSASNEEIRQAYKNLARILHPDQHQGGEQKRLAECQMKRLNGVVGVLTDPVLRAQYDRGVQLPPIPSAVLKQPVGRVAPRLSTWLWVATAAIGACAVMWYLRHNSGSAGGPRVIVQAEGAVSHTPAAAARAPGISKTRARRKRLRAVEAVRKPGESSAWQKGRRRAAVIEALPPPSLVEVEIQPIEAAFSLPSIMEAPLGRFGGTWEYVPPASPPDKRLYPPEFIETVIEEASGALRGRYRARYDVANRAIFPEVDFRFEGRAGPEGATLHWVGEGDSSGEVQLNLLSGSAMKVTWKATSLGSRFGLSSGTAVLVRRVAPGAP